MASRVLAFGPITRSTFPDTAATTRASVTGSTGGQIDQHDVRLLSQELMTRPTIADVISSVGSSGDATAGQEPEDG